MYDLRLQFRSLLWNHGGKLAEYAFMYIFSVIVARMLGAERNGVYVILVTLVQTGLLLSSLGFETTLHRFVPDWSASREDLRGSLRVFLSIRTGVQTLLCVILFFGFPFLFLFFPIGGVDRTIVFLLCLYAFLAGLNNFFGAVLVGQSRTHILSVLRVTVRAGELAGLLILSADGLTIEKVVAVIAAGAAASFLLHLFFAFFDLAGPGRRSDLKPVFSFAGTMWLNMFVVFILGKQMDILLMGKLVSDMREIAFYDVGMMLVQGIVLGTTIGMGGVMLSTFSGIARDHPEKLGQLWRTWVKISIVLVVPLLVVLAFGAFPVVETIYNASYSKSAYLLRLLAAFVIVERMFGSGLNADALLVTGGERLLLRISIGCGVLNVAAAIGLIPLFGAAGAIAATGLSNLAASAATAWMLHRRNRMTVPAGFWAKTLVISIVACSIPAAFNYFFTPISPAAQLVLATALWGVFAKTAGLFTNDDIDVMREMNPVLLRAASFFGVQRSMKNMVFPS